MKVGSVLGHYHVIRTLGQGGMGAVYEASDTRLNRLVALKLLPAKMANNPEWFKRFEREAQAVAALNHPNIVTIHAVEEVDDVHFIILELVGGKTLDEIIPDDGLGLDQFFDIAIPLTDALAAAHRRGIAHRDLKPSNIMVDDEGRVKVLDFGIAKLVEDVPEDEAATQVGSEALTEEGKIVGTVAYMSPEQAEGKAADARSDIFSLGIMLYEMATGNRPFVGDTKLSILASIVKDEPPSIIEHNVRMPRHLARIVKKTLEKDLKRRYQSMVELHNDLVELQEEVESGEPLATGAFTGETAPFRAEPESRSPAWATWAALAAGIVAVAAIGWSFLGGGAPEPAAAPTVSTMQLTTTAGIDFGGTISPDGEWFAYARQSNGATNVYLQSVGSRTPIQLTQSGGVSPAFSPDGALIAFSGPPRPGSITEGGGISIMGRTGDDLRRLTDFGFNPAWSPDGTKIVFGTEYVTSRPYQRTDLGDDLHVLDVESGEITVLDIPDGVQPSWSPNGHRIAYWGSTGGQRDIFTVAADGGDAVPVTEDAAVDFSPVWSPDGAWLYFASTRGGSMAIWRMPIDEETGVLRGEAQQITTGGISEPGMLSVSRDGARILYTATLNRGSIVAADFDPETLTVSSQMVPVVQGSRRLLSPHVSDDGEWIVYFNEGAQQDLFVAHTDGSAERQITDDPAKDWFPRWSPDGRSIAFYSNSTGFYEIWVMNPEGTGRVRLTDSGVDNPIRPIWSHDGSRIIYNTDANSFIVEASLPFDQQQPEVVPRVPDTELILEGRDWSSDGTRILGVCRDEERVPAGICLYWIERGEFEMLAEGNYALPLWMADDRRVLYQLPPTEYRVIDSVTKETWPVVMPESPIPVTALTLSPDDRRAYLNQVESESDIWMLEIG